MGIEHLTFESTTNFVLRAQQQGVPVNVDDYVFGTHSWPYWAKDLSEYLVPLMQTFANPAVPPAAIARVCHARRSPWAMRSIR